MLNQGDFFHLIVYHLSGTIISGRYLYYENM